jgi:hypothetical protein
MDDEELHFPPGAEPETPAPEAPKDEPKPEEAPAPEEEKAPEADKPAEAEEKKDGDPAPEVPLQKKRSVYDDLKETRKELKEAKVRLQELEGGKPADKPAEAPPKDAEPADELDAYAKENNLDAKALGRLAEIIAKRVPNAEVSKTERDQLAELKAWQTDQLAKEQRAAEDREVLASAPAVKTQLEIHDDAELDAVMKEIVKLSHTEEFHDKEVDYIVWKKKDALSKLVSPKKPSFESGGSPAEAGAETEPDFSSGKGVTPEMAQKASQSKGGSALEIRKGK